MILGEILAAIASDCGAILKGVTVGQHYEKYALYMAFLTALNETDKENIDAKIKRQKKAQKEREQAEKRKRKQWVKEVERLQEWRKLCQDLLDSGHFAAVL